MIFHLKLPICLNTMLRGLFIAETKISSVIGEEEKHGQMHLNGKEKKNSITLVTKTGVLMENNMVHSKNLRIWYS